MKVFGGYIGTGMKRSILEMQWNTVKCNEIQWNAMKNFEIIEIIDFNLQVCLLLVR